MVAFLVSCLLRPDPCLIDFNRQPIPIGSFQTNTQAKLSQFLAVNSFVGGTAAVVIDGRLCALAAAGKRKLGGTAALRPGDPMHLASNTKAMTALVFARLVEQGKLRFDETVQEVVPYSVSTDFRDLPLIEFLRQRSGIDNECAPEVFDDKYNPPAETQRFGNFDQLYSSERQLYAKDCLSSQPGYVPMSKFSYANANFMVIGAMEEIASKGRPWEDLIREEVFRPLHMKAAGFGPMGNGKDEREPWQHVQEKGKWVPTYYDNPRYFGPAGSVHCSVLDLLNFAYAVGQGELGRGSYLRAETWQTIVTPPEGSTYACGLVANKRVVNGFRNVGHEGNNTMSCSSWLVTDGGRIIVAVMLNCPTDRIDRLVLDLLKDARDTLH